MKPIVLNAGRLAKKFPQLKDIARDTIIAEMERGAVDIREQARANAPKDTGELRASIVDTVSEDQMHRRVEARANHARPVELGARGVPAQPFLFPAAEQEKPRIKRRIARQLKRESKKVQQ